MVFIFVSLAGAIGDKRKRTTATLNTPRPPTSAAAGTSSSAATTSTTATTTASMAITATTTIPATAAAASGITRELQQLHLEADILKASLTEIESHMRMIILNHGEDSVLLQTAIQSYQQVHLMLTGSFASPILKLDTYTALVCSVNEEHQQAEAKVRQSILPRQPRI